MKLFYPLGKAIAVSFVGVCLTGCGITKVVNDAIQEVAVPPVMVNSLAEKDGLSAEAQKSIINLATYKFGTADNETAKVLATKGKDDRNRLQSDLLSLSDKKCSQFRQFLYAFHGTRKLALRSLTLALSGAGAIFTGGTSQALSAASAGFQGFDEAYDAEVLQQQAIMLILQTIRSTRETMLEGINVKRKMSHKSDGTSTGYTVEEAIQDVGRYHRLCSLTEALAEMAKAIQKP